MEIVLVIIFFVLLVAFIGIIIYMKDAETKAQAEEIANKIEIAFKDMEIKRLEDEIKKLKKRRKK